MKNKINKFYQAIKESIFKYLVYLIIICLLAHLNDDIREFCVYLKDNNPYFLSACLLMLFLLIVLPLIRTKYIKYLFENYLEDFFCFVCVFVSFISSKDNFLSSSVFSITVFLLIKHFFPLQKTSKPFHMQPIIDSDKPIITKEQDYLGREEFVKSLKHILLKNQKFSNNDGFVLILSAGWGEGKTSCLNLLKEKLKEEEKEQNPFEFIDINPWFNDTKEKLLNALFGEINHFTKSIPPRISLETQFDEIIKLSTIKLGSIELELDKFTENKNIQNKIKEIGDKIKLYSKRIIITIDDMDRLDKNHILYILQVVQMFKQYTNIIFILSYDSQKVEEILCESSDSCSSDKTIYKTSYYKNYIERIASLFLPLPKIQHPDIEKVLLKKINKILDEEKMPTINKTDFDFYISTSTFKTIRDIKRFCNSFLISYTEVKNEVNVFNYINITTLFVFYPEIYNEAWNNQYNWFKLKVNIHDNKQLLPIKQYFKDITEKYTEEDIKNIYELIQVISPVYQRIPAEENKNYFKQPNKEQKSYFLNERYLQYYFTHNFLSNRIPDKILDEKFQNFIKETNGNIREENILNFMKEPKYNLKLADFFNYLNIYYKEEYSSLYKQIILIFAKNSFVLSKDFSETIDYISKIISKLDKYRVINVNDFLIEIINVSFSMSFCIEIYERLVSNDNKLNIEQINNILDEKISNNIEQTLESFNNEQHMKHLYTWLRKYYVIHVSEIVDIINLESNDYMLIRNKVNKVLPFIKNNSKYFMTFIGENLEQTLRNYKEDKSLGLNNISVSNFIYLIDIWGKNNILEMLNNFISSKKLEHYERIVKIQKQYEEVISDKNIKKVIEDHEEKLLKKIATNGL